MKSFLLLAFSLLFAIVVACQPVGQSGNNSALRPGDEIGGMTITKDIDAAPPLWMFCSPAREDGQAASVDCRVPPLPALAIGYTLGLADPVLQTLDWLTLNWEFSLDGQTVDLPAFGTYDYVRPDLAASPSQIREIFRQFKAWDVVLINLRPGLHTIHGTARTETNAYTWVIDLTINADLAQ